MSITAYFQNILTEDYEIQISYSTLQRFDGRGISHFQEEESVQIPQTTSLRLINGIMLQADASIHLWLEDCGPKLALIALIDDATNKVWGILKGYENAVGYAAASCCLFDRGDLYGNLY